MEVEARCTYLVCVKGILTKREAIEEQNRLYDLGKCKVPARPLPRHEYNHHLRNHSDTPVCVKNKKLDTAIGVRFHRRGSFNMKFKCFCGNTFLARESMARHYNQVCSAKNLPSIKGAEYLNTRDIPRTDLEFTELTEAFSDNDETGSDGEIETVDTAQMTRYHQRNGDLDSFLRGFENQLQAAQARQLTALEKMMEGMESRIMSSIARKGEQVESDDTPAEGAPAPAPSGSEAPRRTSRRLQGPPRGDPSQPYKRLRKIDGTPL
ncbi:hypothetical protein BGZ72_007705 [Mortierella alpina]|nr:hypothetical protein BGZ72_007705 [Mortierella alpina]